MLYLGRFWADFDDFFFFLLQKNFSEHFKTCFRYLGVLLRRLKSILRIFGYFGGQFLEIFLTCWGAILGGHAAKFFSDPQRSA